MYHINRIKEKNNMIIVEAKEHTFAEIQHLHLLF